MIYASYSQYLVKDVERETVPDVSPLSPFSIETAKERMPDKEFKNRIIPSQNYPLWTIVTPNKKYELSKPIKVRIYTEDDLFLAENETLIIVGTGNSIAAAMDDFRRHVIHFYHYYKKLSWKEVTGDAVRLKKIYELLFAEQE